VTDCRRTGLRRRLGNRLWTVALLWVGVGGCVACGGASGATTSSPPVRHPSSPVRRAGPIVEPARLLSLATGACARTSASNPQVCAGAVDAYVWGLPLVTVTHALDRLACRAGVNHLSNHSTLASPGSSSVVSPSVDTLYSAAWLNLRNGPQVLSVPAVSGRYVNFQLIDAYTNTFADIGDLTDDGAGGRYAIVSRGWHGRLPRGVHRIDAPTPEVWLLGRTEVDGPRDLTAAARFQHRYRLAAFGPRRPPRWTHHVPAGTYGTDYLARALVAQVGLA
jgi:hypothetical protein